MKKNIYLLIIISVLILTGCGKRDQMTNFIATPIPVSEESNEESNQAGTEEDTETVTEEGTEVTPTPKPLHVGQTTTKYVKMDEYDAILNVRETPSKDGAVVGFLVHAEKIDVIDIVDGWASFALGNEKRYVSADFLVDVRPEYIAPPSPAPTIKLTPTPKPTPSPTPDPNGTPPEI